MTSIMEVIHRSIFSQKTRLKFIALKLKAPTTKYGARSFHACRRVASRSALTPLGGQLQARIKMNGPLTVADYMKEVLINPSTGYYMHKDVFGRSGDFITSPEISQMFGELVGVWCVNEWQQSGSPTPLQLIELGPGRGTLMDDILRAVKQVDETMLKHTSVHLVEVSPHLSHIQQETLTGRREIPGHMTTVEPADAGAHTTCGSRHGPKVNWHTALADVPTGKFSIVIAHEFFDALPVHKFQKKEGVWCEMLVDNDLAKDGPHRLRYVLSPGPTLASTMLLRDTVLEEGCQHVEVCAEGGLVVQQVAARLEEGGGRALLADYGHNGAHVDSFRAFRQHTLHDPLCEPGTADLTADVDFAYLSRHATNVCVAGPVTQETFLHNMGIGYRLKAIFDHGKVTTEQRKSLISGYDILINPKKMGERFKFLSLHTKQHEGYIPAGFKPLT